MLTRPWELGDRQLRVLDFATRQFHQQSSKTLFAKPGLNSAELEAWLNLTIETPVAQVANRLRGGAVLQPPDDWQTLKALALLLFLNSQRLNEARWNEKATITLEDIARSTTQLDERIARYFLAKFKIFLGRTPAEHDLFFTEAVGFPYPLPGFPLIVVPLGLHCVLCAYDGPYSYHSPHSPPNCGLQQAWRSLGLAPRS
jgi:hypothetical protein